MRELISAHPIDHNFEEGQFNDACQKAYTNLKDHILSAPILQQADITKRFYLKTDFSAVGLGFTLCQPDNSKEALEAMKQEDEGGECEFDISITNKLHLLLVALGSRKTVGN
eukprot:scaffold5015_cov51-Attheya_sp.AAC.1